MTTEYSGSGDPARSLALLWGTATSAPPRAASPRLTVDAIVRGRDRARRRGRARRAVHAPARRAARRQHDVALHLRAGQGRAARPHARHRARRDRPARRARRRLAGPARARRAGELGALPPPPVDAPGRRPPGPPLGPERDRQVRLRAARGRRHRPHRRRDGLGADARARLRRSRRRGRPLEATLVEQRTGLTDEEWWAAQAPLLEKVIDAGAVPDRGPASAPRRARPTAASGTRSTPSSSASSGCSTGSRRWWA